MKKIILSLAIIGILLAPTVGLAQPEAKKTPLPSEAEVDVLLVITRIVKYAYGIFLTIAALCIILSAYGFVTAAGEPEKVNKARNYLLYALIGILIAVITSGLLELVKKIGTETE